MKQTFKSVDIAIAKAGDTGSLAAILAALLAREAIVRGLMDNESDGPSSSATTGVTHASSDVRPQAR